MFEVFAGMCFYAALGLKQCDDYTVEAYDDQLTCEIVANDYRQDRRWINPACIPGPEVEEMPEGEPLLEPIPAANNLNINPSQKDY